ncbi:MAG: hypothetical protein COA94_06510 [Rickettsiales bacterium]|nr:MAG: hypothetical protein COA94_06510 [Rickettsiales bacterium]
MKKKILLTTALSLVPMFANGAGPVNTTYQGNNIFATDNQEFTGIIGVGQHLADAPIMIASDRNKYFRDMVQDNSILALMAGNIERLGRELKSNIPPEILQKATAFLAKVTKEKEKVLSARKMINENFDGDFSLIDAIQGVDPKNLTTAAIKAILQNAYDEKRRGEASVDCVVTPTTAPTAIAASSATTSSAPASAEDIKSQKELAHLQQSEQRYLRQQGGEKREKMLKDVQTDIDHHPRIEERRKSESTQEDFQDCLVDIADETDEAKKEALVKRLREDLRDYISPNIKRNTAPKRLVAAQQPETAALEAMTKSVQTISRVVGGRMASLSHVGVSSGEAFESYGVWLKGTYSQGEQKAYDARSGYKFDQKAVTIGVDTGEESLIGAAYSFSSGKATSKNNKDNKDDITAHIATIYGKYAITDKTFVSAQGQIGTATIKKQRDTGTSTIAKANPKASILGGKIELGYVMTLADNVAFIPTIGFDHASVKVKGYTIKGGTNKSVGKMTETRTSVIGGATMQYVHDTGHMKFSPEIHVNGKVALSAKNSDTKIKFGPLAPVTTPSEEAARASYNIGASLKVARCDMLEVSAGYDFDASEKFTSHTGTLKLRVNM